MDVLLNNWSIVCLKFKIQEIFECFKKLEKPICD